MRRILPFVVLLAACGPEVWSTPPDATTDSDVAEILPDEEPVIDVSPERCDFEGASLANPVTCTVSIQDFGEDVLVIESVALKATTTDCVVEDPPAPQTPVYPLETVIEVHVRCFPAGTLAANALVIRSSDPERPVVEVPFDWSPPTDLPTCEKPGAGPVPVPTGPLWPASNAWSWDGSWTPADLEFPIPGLFDDEYFDGHIVLLDQVSPILPPGRWDWDDEENDLATWRGFKKDIGTWEQLVDPCGHHFGWRLVPNAPGAVDFGGAAEYFEGSPGTDLLFLGAAGKLHSIEGGLGDGPDVLVFNEGWSLDYWTGSTLTGSSHDDDLVVIGCTPRTGPDDLYSFHQAMIHTGPGADRVFVRDIAAAGIDAGNGGGGDTSVLDSGDGDDLVVFRGNVKDHRFFGGYGNDVAVWYVAEMTENAPFQGGDFFGGGGWGDAIWGDPGTDRLVLVLPPDTPIVDAPQTPPGSLLVMAASDELHMDEGTKDYFDGRYCIPCGKGPGGEVSLIIEWVSPDGSIDTGYVSVTAFEELQLGAGAGAKVFRLDQVAGHAILDATLKPIDVPEWPDALCAM